MAQDLCIYLPVANHETGLKHKVPIYADQGKEGDDDYFFFLFFFEICLKVARRSCITCVLTRVESPTPSRDWMASMSWLRDFTERRCYYDLHDHLFQDGYFLNYQ